MKNQLIAIALVALLLPVFIIAEETTTNTDRGQEVTPDILKPLDLNIFEKIKLAFANSSEKKAQVLLRYAEKKHTKIETLYTQEKTQKAEQLQKKYDLYLKLANKYINDAEYKGNDVSQLVKEVEDIHEKHLQVLQLVKAKNPDAPGLDKAIANAQYNIEKRNAKKVEKEEVDSDKDETDAEEDKNKASEKSQGKGKK